MAVTHLQELRRLLVPCQQPALRVRHPGGLAADAGFFRRGNTPPARIYNYICVYIYIYIYREREREIDR